VGGVKLARSVENEDRALREVAPYSPAMGASSGGRSVLVGVGRGRLLRLVARCTEQSADGLHDGMGLRSTQKIVGPHESLPQARWYAIYFISAISAIESDGTWLISAAVDSILLTERDRTERGV
jgi:hypothetical protein